MSAPTSDAADFVAHLSARLDDYGDRPFIEFERRWYSGADITGCIRTLAATLADLGVTTSEPVGVIVRNRVPHAAAVLGCVAALRPVVMINSYQSAASLARDIDRLRPAVIIADHQDWTPPVLAAAEHHDCAGIALSSNPLGVEPVLRRRNADEPARELPGLRILTSGTTGPPKHVSIGTAALRHTVLSMTGGQPGRYLDPPELVYWPFGSVGICQLLAAPYLGKRMVLFEKFSVDEWVRAVKTYRVTRAGVQPAIVRMLLESDVDPADLASLEYLPGGSGPLEPDLRERFRKRFGIPLLWAYGATEFAGSLCAWTPDLHRRFGASKPDSVGKPLPGVHLRVIDPDTEAEAAQGEAGFLEAAVDGVTTSWLRTTDLASIDADGFVTIHGRGDGAINRGGFKVLPETVRAALLTHPAVRDACVVGVADNRLGHVPFAAVETWQDSVPPTEQELKDLVREVLPSHHIPVAVALVDNLPRNAALKVRIDEVASLYPVNR